MLFTEDQSQVLLVLTAAPGSEYAEKLALLSVLGCQAFTSAADTVDNAPPPPAASPAALTAMDIP